LHLLQLLVCLQVNPSQPPTDRTHQPPKPTKRHPVTLCSDALTIQLHFTLDPDLTLAFESLKAYDEWESGLRLLLAMVNPAATGAAALATPPASPHLHPQRAEQGGIHSLAIQHGLVRAALGVQAASGAGTSGGRSRGGWQQRLKLFRRRASVDDPMGLRLSTAQDWAARSAAVVAQHLPATAGQHHHHHQQQQQQQQHPLAHPLYRKIQQQQHLQFQNEQQWQQALGASSISGGGGVVAAGGYVWTGTGASPHASPHAVHSNSEDGSHSGSDGEDGQGSARQRAAADLSIASIRAMLTKPHAVQGTAAQGSSAPPHLKQQQQQQQQQQLSPRSAPTTRCSRLAPPAQELMHHFKARKSRSAAAASAALDDCLCEASAPSFAAGLQQITPVSHAASSEVRASIVSDSSSSKVGKRVAAGVDGVESISTKVLTLTSDGGPDGASSPRMHAHLEDELEFGVSIASVRGRSTSTGGLLKARFIRGCEGSEVGVSSSGDGSPCAAGAADDADDGGYFQLQPASALHTSAAQQAPAAAPARISPDDQQEDSSFARHNSAPAALLGAQMPWPDSFTAMEAAINGTDCTAAVQPLPADAELLYRSGESHASSATIGSFVFASGLCLPHHQQHEQRGECDGNGEQEEQGDGAGTNPSNGPDTPCIVFSTAAFGLASRAGAALLISDARQEEAEGDEDGDSSLTGPSFTAGSFTAGSITAANFYDGSFIGGHSRNPSFTNLCSPTTSGALFGSPVQIPGRSGRTLVGALTGGGSNGSGSFGSTHAFSREQSARQSSLKRTGQGSGSGSVAASKAAASSSGPAVAAASPGPAVAAPPLPRSSGSGSLASPSRPPLVRSSSGGSALPPLPSQLDGGRALSRRGSGVPFASLLQVALLPALLEAEVYDEGQDGRRASSAAAGPSQQEPQMQDQQSEEEEEEEEAALAARVDKAGPSETGVTPAPLTSAAEAPKERAPTILYLPTRSSGGGAASAAAVRAPSTPGGAPITMVGAYHQALASTTSCTARFGHLGPFGQSPLQRGESSVLMGAPISGVYGLTPIATGPVGNSQLDPGSPRHLQLKVPKHRRESSAHSFLFEGSGQWSAGACRLWAFGFHNRSLCCTVL